MMNRDQYLAQEVMGWEQRKWLGSLWWDDPLRGEGIFEYIMLYAEWEPGESWPQTGMILEAMEKDFRIEIYRNTRKDDGVAYRVVFMNWNRDAYGGDEGGDDLREAIATAAARAKGWSDDEPVG